MINHLDNIVLWLDRPRIGVQEHPGGQLEGSHRQIWESFSLGTAHQRDRQTWCLYSCGIGGWEVYSGQ